MSTERIEDDQLDDLRVLLQDPGMDVPAVSDSDLILYAADALESEEAACVKQAVARSAGIRRRLERIRTGMRVLDSPQNRARLVRKAEEALEIARDVHPEALSLTRQAARLLIGVVFRQDVDFERVRHNLIQTFGAGTVFQTSLPAPALSMRGTGEAARRPAFEFDLVEGNIEKLADVLHDALRPGIAYTIERGGRHPLIRITEGESREEIIRKLRNEIRRR